MSYKIACPKGSMGVNAVLKPRQFRASIAVLLLIVCCPAEPLAQETQPAPALPAAPVAADSSAAVTPAPASVEEALAQSRELVKSGDYDRAIEILRGALERPDVPTPLRKDTYLQLIKTYVIRGNDLKYQPQGRNLSDLNYGAARELVAQCLSIPDLRRTRPEPTTDYPPEMVRMFADVRAELLGAFRVVELNPATATVLFDEAELPLGTDCVRSDDDLKAGPHRVTVTAPGYKPRTDNITISPGATLERSYELSKRHGPLWYVTRGVVAVGAVVGTVLLARGEDETPPVEQPLPAAPPPPTR